LLLQAVLLSGWLPVVRQQSPRQQWLAASRGTLAAGAWSTAAAAVEQLLGCLTEPQLVKLLLLLLRQGLLLAPGPQ
jgi:hypothetical protein